MHGRRFDTILTGTAIALVLGLASLSPAAAQTAAQASTGTIEARVSMPEATTIVPATDDAKPAEDATGSTPITLPEPPDLPPPSFKDAAPAPAAAPTPAPAPAASAPVAAPAPAPTASAPAAAPAPAPVAAAPVAAPVAADQPLRDALRDAITTKLARIIDRKAERTAVEAFYSSRDYAPVFYSVDGATALGKQAINHLRNADADGMDPSDYPVPSAADTSPAALAEAEIKLTDSILDYARHAAMGRVHWSRVSGDIWYEQSNAPQPLDVLAKVGASTNAEEALDSYQPPHALYKALRKKLAEVRGKSETSENKMPNGPVLEIATDKATRQTVLMTDERVPMLRAKLGLEAVKDDLFYDRTLADAVAAFQKEKGLSANGRLTQATVDAMNGKKQERLDQLIIANMERWRWLPRDLGKGHVVLNIPDYTLRVYNGGHQIWTTRVVVGKPGSHATPILTETMKYVTVNPTWNVPPSIVYNEYLPALKQDPTVLTRMGLKLEQNRDGSVHISQPPGEANALGRIRFNFPNKFLVYQHDTPDKHLFAHPKRAYSHGCMRVQDPAMYAQVVTGLGMPGSNYTAEKIKGMFGHSEIDLRFTTPIPVHITYQTAFVDDNGQLQTREDIYGRDNQTLAALKTDRRNGETPVARAGQNYSRPSVKLPNGMGNDGSNGQSFFDRLFGNPIRQEPAQARQPQQQRRVGANQRTVTAQQPGWQNPRLSRD